MDMDKYPVTTTCTGFEIGFAHWRVSLRENTGLALIMDYSILFEGWLIERQVLPIIRFYSQIFRFFSAPLQKNCLIQIPCIWMKFDQRISLNFVEIHKNLRLKSKVFPKLEQSIFKCMMSSFI